MKMKTLLIVPAFSDQAGQCRIVATYGFTGRSELKDYRENPENWAEVGLMTSRGKLVCYDGTPEENLFLKACEPLAAGMTFNFV
ncbi:hypothetical protein AB4Y32_25265 [Paraburkholderia phymatum]|uniref:Uncharacterized protein n=1 Tax=Paraburkholderia phymatum TaxID=148447 RepID=A0ACC6U604_9BURK